MENNVETVTYNKAVYIILALLFWVFGVHKFYKGDIGGGICYILLNILLGWTVIAPFIMFIIVIVDVITTANMKSDRDGNITERYY